MSKPSQSSSKAPARNTRRKSIPSPGFDALEKLVIPVLNDYIPEDVEEPLMEVTNLDDGRTHLCAVLHHRHALKVLGDEFDQERAYLRLTATNCRHASSRP